MSREYLNKKKKVIALTMYLLLSFSILGQLPNDILNANKKLNAEILSSHFNDKIELVLPNNSGVFSINQAKLIIQDFFKKYPIVSFEIIHSGKSANSTFAIGRYKTYNNNFRFYFLIKKKDNVSYINQLRIEEEDSN